MTTVKGFLQLFTRKPEYAHDKENFELMISELDRANSILSDFLSIAKRDPLYPKYEIGSLEDILFRLKPLIEAEAFEHHNQLQYCITEPPAIRLNEKEIRQLLLNLVRNGLDAMPAGGTLIVKTFRQNNHVVLAVKDQGHGIDPAISHKIGTPFFTTKDNGTGLGLAVCYGIAHRHNAAIHIDTSPDGTTFTIHFPIALTSS
jgi:signal transduction histidine kinase